jgi:hypothetical protein
LKERNARDRLLARRPQKQEYARGDNTAHNVHPEAYKVAGYVGEVYGLARHLFKEEEITEWAERRSVLAKSIEDAALGMASVYRGLSMQLPGVGSAIGLAVTRAAASFAAASQAADVGGRRRPSR